MLKKTQLFSLLALIPSVCHAQTEGIRYNLLYVFTDQQRRASLGFMNEDPVVTPNIDRLATEGVYFSNAVSSSPISTPHRGCLMTGMYPHSNGVLRNGDTLNHQFKTFPEVLKENGYQTAYIGKWHLYSHQFIPKREHFGFDFWLANNYNGDHFRRLYYKDSPTPFIDERGWVVTYEIDQALEYLQGALENDAPFALFVSHHPPHSNDLKSFKKHNDIKPHTPIQGENYKRNVQFIGPEEYMESYYGQKIKRRPNVPANANGGDGGFAVEACPGHFGMINAIDADFGRLLQFLEQPDPRYPDKKLRETTLLIFTADHGEMLGSHELMYKDIYYEESIGVPFIISCPGLIPEGQRCDKVFNSIDIMPTILSLLKLPIPETVQGDDFSPAILGKKMKDDNSAYISYFTGGWDKDRMTPDEGYWRAVRTDRYTYVVASNYTINTRIVGEIYNIPKELHLNLEEDQKVEFLFDNLKDPYQMSPILNDGSRKIKKIFDTLRTQMIHYLCQTGDSWLQDVIDLGQNSR